MLPPPSQSFQFAQSQSCAFPSIPQPPPPHIIARKLLARSTLPSLYFKAAALSTCPPPPGSVSHGPPSPAMDLAEVCFQCGIPFTSPAFPSIFLVEAHTFHSYAQTATGTAPPLVCVHGDTPQCQGILLCSMPGVHRLAPCTVTANVFSVLWLRSTCCLHPAFSSSVSHVRQPNSCKHVLSTSSAFFHTLIYCNPHRLAPQQAVSP